jgi:hypothetical protein
MFLLPTSKEPFTVQVLSGNNIILIFLAHLHEKMTSHLLNVLEVVEFEKSVYEFCDNGIVMVSIKDNVHMELEDSVKEYDMLMTKTDYIPLKVMIKGGTGSSTSKEVRDYANSYEARKIMKAQALVVKSLAQKIMADFISKFYKIPVNLKIFSDEEKAIEWLKEQ